MSKTSENGPSVGPDAPRSAATQAGSSDGGRGEPAATALDRGGSALLVALAVGVPAGAIVGGRSAAVSVAVGALLSFSNLWVLRRVVRRLASPGSGSVGIALTLPLKFVGVVALAYAAVHFGLAEPLALSAGFAAVPLALSLLSLRGSSTARFSPSPE